VQVEVEVEGDAEGVDADAEGVDADVDADVDASGSPTDVDAADLGLVQVSKFPCARSNAVLKSGSCCLMRTLFMGMVL
jgi:hypothetical protein